MKPASLLRWYPRAWRERYGSELAALIQDDLDEGRPAWRLRLSVIGGGLRERFRQARHAAAASLTSPAWHNRWGTIVLAGLICGFLAGDLTSPLSAGRRSGAGPGGRREQPWRPEAGWPVWSSSRALIRLLS